MKKHRHVKGNFYGIAKVKFISHGSWSDPEVIYRQHSFNYFDLENTLMGFFLDEKGVDSYKDEYEDEFEKWVFDNQSEAHYILDEWIDGGYFNEYYGESKGKSKEIHYTDRIYGGYFTYDEMVEDAKANYDYGDPTNFLTYMEDWWEENYKEVS